MDIEKREEDRSIFTRQPKGKLQVLAGDRCVYVSAVLNMSLTGIRLETNAHLNIGEEVLVRYQAVGVDLKLNGTVIWSAVSSAGHKGAAKSHAYTVGIKLATPSILRAFW